MAVSTAGTCHPSTSERDGLDHRRDYALTYTGFAAPYLLALAAHLASYAILLMITAGLALATAAFISRRTARPGTFPALQAADQPHLSPRPRR